MSGTPGDILYRGRQAGGRRAAGRLLARARKACAQMCPGKTSGDIATPGGTQQRLGGGSGGPGYFNAAAFCPAPNFGQIVNTSVNPRVI